MKTLLLCLVFGAAVLVGCATHYPYPADLATAERTIAQGRPLEQTYLFPEARGDTWIRYRVVYFTGGQVITNGTAMLRVAHGKASVSGPEKAQTTIKRVLDLK